jgi:hypothetical protein
MEDGLCAHSLRITWSNDLYIASTIIGVDQAIANSLWYSQCLNVLVGGFKKQKIQLPLIDIQSMQN